jgi:hypothetical protein
MPSCPLRHRGIALISAICASVLRRFMQCQQRLNTWQDLASKDVVQTGWSPAPGRKNRPDFGLPFRIQCCTNAAVSIGSTGAGAPEASVFGGLDLPIDDALCKEECTLAVVGRLRRGDRNLTTRPSFSFAPGKGLALGCTLSPLRGYVQTGLGGRATRVSVVTSVTSLPTESSDDC